MLTEGEVAKNPVGVLEEGGDGSLERPDVVHARLRTTVEVLVGELGDEDGVAEAVVVVGDVVDEVLRVDVVPVDGLGIERAALALVVELLHPLLAGGVARGGRGDELVAEVLLRLDVLLPELDGLLRRHVGLANLVRPKRDLISIRGQVADERDVLVHAQDPVGVALLDVLLELIDILVAPELNHGREAEVADVGRNAGAPVVEARGSM